LPQIPQPELQKLYFAGLILPAASDTILPTCIFPVKEGCFPDRIFWLPLERVFRQVQPAALAH
jgi:hypothetical protein